MPTYPHIESYYQELEDIIIDPIYTAKSTSALIAEIQGGNVDPTPHSLHRLRRHTPNLRLPRPTLELTNLLARRKGKTFIIPNPHSLHRYTNHFHDQ